MRQASAAWWTWAALLLAAGCGRGEVESAGAIAETGTDSAFSVPVEELYGASPVDNLWSPRIELEIPGLPRAWDGARFALVSDLQLGLWEGNEEVAAAAIQRAVEANPDAVFLLGDFLAEGDDTGTLERLLQPLRGRATVAVLGDRDVRTDSLEARITAVLTGSGATVLKNSVTALQRGGENLTIAGVDPGIVASAWEEQQYILATLTPPGSASILLTHAPALATRAPMGRFPVILGANTFCGDVEVPGTPRLSWLRDEALPGGQVEGIEQMFLVQGSVMYVTCGLGYGFVPLRFGSAPEVPILTIRSDRAPAPIDTLPNASTAADSLMRALQDGTAGTISQDSAPPD